MFTENRFCRIHDNILLAFCMDKGCYSDYTRTCVYACACMHLSINSQCILVRTFSELYRNLNVIFFLF